MIKQVKITHVTHEGDIKEIIALFMNAWMEDEIRKWCTNQYKWTVLSVNILKEF